VSEDTSPGGSRILRHKARERDFEATGGDPALIEAIDAHLVATFGEYDGTVFHELVSDLVHVDVNVVPPGPEREWTTLVTSGMAERPMTVPEEIEDYRHAELVLALPADWPLGDDAFEDERAYWPVRLLKQLARLPHEFETFLYYGHTVPNGDPPEPYAEGTALCGAMIGRPLLTPDEFEEVRLPDDRLVHIFGVFPLYADEMDLKLANGADELWERLAEAHVTELVDPDRASVAGRRRGLFRRR
jgi:hypothetical protein